MFRRNAEISLVCAHKTEAKTKDYGCVPAILSRLVTRTAHFLKAFAGPAAEPALGRFVSWPSVMALIHAGIDSRNKHRLRLCSVTRANIERSGNSDLEMLINQFEHDYE